MSRPTDPSCQPDRGISTAVAQQPNSAKQRLNSLTALRFFAALFVLLFPAWYPFSKDPRVGVINYGYTSVGFFFVLSGFVLAWTWRPDIPIRTLWWRRIARVFPVCALFTVVVAVYFVSVPDAVSTGHEPSWGSFLQVVFLLQAWPTFQHLLDYNYPSWSLSTEMFFYFMLPFLAIALNGVRRRAIYVGIAVLCLTAYAAWAYWFYRANMYSFTPGSLLAFPSLQLLKFAAGAAVGMAFRKGWRPRINLWLALAIVICAYAVIGWLRTVEGPAPDFRTTEMFPDLVMLVPMMLLICAAASWDLRGRTGFGSSRILVLLGDSSFALYLVHAPVLMAVDQIRVRTGHLEPPGFGWMSVYIAVCLTLAWLVHRLFETPVERMLRALPNRRRATTMADQPVVAAALVRPD